MAAGEKKTNEGTSTDAIAGLVVKSPEEMETFAAGCAQFLPPGFNLYLQGELGAGKTAFVRGILRGLGYRGTVRSPTYTLVEQYHIAGREIYHLDLYRMASATELDDIGCRDYFDGLAICLVEWPERGRSSLPSPDLLIKIAIDRTQRDLNCQAQTPAGEKFLQQFATRPIPA